MAPISTMMERLTTLVKRPLCYSQEVVSSKKSGLMSL
jgi:hypothetical protein